MEALRYIAAPPISTDDLVTVSEVREGEWVAANLWPTVVSTVLPWWMVTGSHGWRLLENQLRPSDTGL